MWEFLSLLACVMLSLLVCVWESLLQPRFLICVPTLPVMLTLLACVMWLLLACVWESFVIAGLCDAVIAGLCVGVLNSNRGFWFVYQFCM